MCQYGAESERGGITAAAPSRLRFDTRLCSWSTHAWAHEREEKTQSDEPTLRRTRVPNARQLSSVSNQEAGRS